MVGGRDYRKAPVQPRDPGPAPAGLVVQAVHPRRGAEPASAPGSVWPSRKRVFSVPNAAEKFTSTTSRAPTRASRRSPAPHVLRQLGLRRGRHQGRHAEGRAAGPAHGHPHAGLHEPRDDARRPARGRHAARHGARLRDVRHARRAAIAGHARRSGSAAGRHPQRQAPTRASRRVDRNKASPSRCSRAAWPTAATSIVARSSSQGTGRARAVDGEFAAGKTGTTENSGDAWFVGFTER